MKKEGDFSIADIKRILGVGNSTAYNNKYVGEYTVNGVRRVRREVFLSRRARGLDVTVNMDNEEK